MVLLSSRVKQGPPLVLSFRTNVRNLHPRLRSHSWRSPHVVRDDIYSLFTCSLLILLNVKPINKNAQPIKIKSNPINKPITQRAEDGQ